MSADRYRYGPWREGPDPLAPPFDMRRAVDELGERVLGGRSPADALRDLLRRGTDGRRGLDDLLAQVRRRQREAHERGRLDGTLEEVRRLLDTAVGQERAVLFPDPSDEARLRESELDSLPADPARAVLELRGYDWRSPAAAQTYQQIRDLLRGEVLDQQFRGLKQALSQPDPEAMARIRDMLTDLNAMLAADARGQDTTAAFEQFMDRHGDLFPERPADLTELVDALARRAAAAERMMRSLSAQQRRELADLVAGALADAGLAEQMAELGAALRARRPDLDWSSPARMHGQEPLGLGEATTALEELAELEALESALAQDYPGARLDDIDEEQVRQALGRSAVADLDLLRRLERELERQGYLSRSGGRLELTPKAVRRLGETALRRIFEGGGTGRGDHEAHDAGAAGELTGASRAWRFGDEQPVDVVRTVVNAVRRSPLHRAAVPEPEGARRGVRLSVEDFEVAETEARTAAAVCLLVDMSYSMVLRDTWPAAKRTALALHTLATTRFPQDAVEVIGFSAYARRVSPGELAELQADTVQGTNLQHALMLAGRFLDRHRDFEPVVIVVTDGEPTAHLSEDGHAWFAWPPDPRTVVATLAEVDRMTRRAATVNVFQLDDDPALTAFVEEIARRNGGRVLSPSAQGLGGYVVSDYLSRRPGRHRR